MSNLSTVFNWTVLFSFKDIILIAVGEQKMHLGYILLTFLIIRCNIYLEIGNKF